jgi:hypothetical protein
MMTPTLLGFAMILFGAFVLLFTVMRAEADADRERRRAAARVAPSRGVPTGMRARM